MLDKFFTNMHTLYEKFEVLGGLGKSDHDIVVVYPHLSEKFVTPKKYPVQVRSCSQNEKAMFYYDLKSISWENLYELQSCSEKFAYYQNVMTTLLELHFPWKTVYRNSNDKPWVTDHFRELCIRKHQASTSGNKPLYKQLKAKVNHMSANLKKKYYQENAEENNPHKMWQLTKTLTGTNKKSNHALQSLANKQCNGDMAALADKINAFFESISSDLPPLPPSKPQTELPEIPDRYIIRVQDMEKQLSSIKLRKAPGPDGVPNWVLRDFAPILSGPLTSIVNSSIRESHVPVIWKSADVLPLPKISPPKSVEKDLRPISLTPAVSKACMEHFVYQWLWDCIKDQIDPSQFGARKGCSTVYALIKLLHEWFSATDKLKTVVDIVLIDYAKAFDHLNHNIIISKLQNMEVPQFLVNWVSSFLHDRYQRVKIGNITSPWLHINGGVPQGTKLGPLLFLVMINDLKPPNPTTKFVDDTTVYEIKPLTGPGTLQQSLNIIQEWSHDNDMRLNPSKTKQLSLNFSFQKQASQILFIENEQIDHEKVVKLLGLLIQEDLKWDSHVDKIVKKASQRLRILTVLRKSGYSPSQLVQVYHTHIRSLLDYACQVWNPGLTLSQMQDIERIQIRALSIIEPHMSYWKALDKFSLVTLDERRKILCKQTYQRMKEPGNVLHDLLPATRVNTHNVRSFKTRKTIKTRIKRSDGSFINYALKNF